MSADNWTNCPRCQKERQKIIADFERQVADLYGKVPVEEFDTARADLEIERRNLVANTLLAFREDYEITGAEEGVVHVKYRGACTKCKLRMEFDTDHPIPGI